MFLALAVLLRGGMGFWASLGLSCLLTLVLYAVMVWWFRKLGLQL
jgi:hypothetical protein